MIHAYVRCSTLDQNPQLQIDAAIKAGADRIWLERRSAVASRPELERLFYSIRKGDLVIVWKLDRLARSLSDLLRVLDRINRHGALFQSLTEPVETRTPAGRMFTQMLGAFSEFERALIVERCAAGRLSAVARGVRFGRPVSVDRDAIAELLNRGMSQKDIAEKLGCNRGTVSRLVNSGNIPGHGPSRP